MFNFYVDAYADMFGEDLKKNGLNLTPSKIKKGKETIFFEGYESAEAEAEFIKGVAKREFTAEPLSADEWYDFFKIDLQNGLDIIFFSVSFNMLLDNGQSLKTAFARLNKDFPKSKSILINTHTVSRGTSEIASMTRLVYNKNQDIDEALDFAETIIGKFVSVFALNDVSNIKHSRLLSNIADSFSGASLNLKPILCIDTEGKFKLLDKAKGFKSAISKLYSNVKENGMNIADYTFSIVSFDADAEAQELYDRFRKIVTENEVRLVKMSPNNAIFVGGKCVALTFHSRF